MTTRRKSDAIVYTPPVPTRAEIALVFAHGLLSGPVRSTGPTTVSLAFAYADEFLAEAAKQAK